VLRDAQPEVSRMAMTQRVSLAVLIGQIATPAMVVLNETV
jgi:hypothetical protein